jgi:O-acetyl-ADP-ribose deacetylase (regulator of RNase III)
MIGNFEKIGELEWRLPDMREGRCLDFSLGFEIEAGKGSNSLCSAELSGRAHKNGNVLGKIKTVKVLGVSEEDYVRISEKPDDLEEGRREMFVKLCGGPVLGDLTAPPPAREFPVEAIVNSTDVLLSRVGELSKAVHRAAGPELEEECRRIGRCGVGKAVVTKGYDLPAEWIIHTVCLPFSTAEIHAVDILYECFENCIKAAVERGIRTLAFPAIGVGAMQFPPGVAAKTAMRSIVSLLSSYREIESVLFVCRTERIKSYYDEAFSAITGRSPHPLTKEERDDSSL